MLEDYINIRKWDNKIRKDFKLNNLMVDIVKTIGRCRQFFFEYEID